MEITVPRDTIIIQYSIKLNTNVDKVLGQRMKGNLTITYLHQNICESIYTGKNM